MKEKVKEIIEGYCEGITWLEFNVSDLDEMVDKILELRLDEYSAHNLAIKDKISNTYYYIVCKKAGIEYKQTYKVNSILEAIIEYEKDYGIEGYELIMVGKCEQ